MIAVTLTCIFLALCFWSLRYLHKKRQYFKDLNVKHLKPNLFFGNSFDALCGKMHQAEKIGELYRAFPNEEVLGYYELLNPIVVPRSAELMDTIFVKSFSNFHDRVRSSGEIMKPEDADLFTLTGNTWKAVRQKFSPLFTSGKLKMMYGSMADCGKSLASVLDEKDGQEVEMSEVMGLYSMDVIGSTAFGLDAKSLQNPDSKFRQMARKMFEGSLKVNLHTLIFLLFPKVAKFFNIKGFIRQDVGPYFFDIIRNTLKFRKENNIERNDFVQMLLQLKEKGKIEVQLHEKADDFILTDQGNETFELEMTDNILIGASFSFLAAGFHSTSMSLTYALFELSQHPEALNKLLAEIESTVQGEEPTYEELKKMSYLEKVIKEAVRLYPTAPTIGRTCTKEFTTPGGFVFKPGQAIFIPVMAIHTDPAYWPDPLVFNPDRFQEDCPPLPGTYLPFGDGPRICIAMRFAMLEMKYAMVILLKNYRFELSKKTKLPLKMHPRVFLNTPLGGITFRVTKIK